MKALQFSATGDLAALRIPGAATALPPERLWAHTCFEAFVGTPDGAAYREFNFSPNGQWMRFDFSGYRERVESPVLPAPQITLHCAGDVLEPEHLPQDVFDDPEHPLAPPPAQSLRADWQPPVDGRCPRCCFMAIRAQP